MRCSQFLSAIVVTLCFHAESWGQTRFSKDQQLVIAAYELEVDTVKALLADGANPNARLGVYDQHLFEDKWMLGHSPVGSERWTPLLAVASSHREPQPTNRTENTVGALQAAQKKMRELDPELIRECDERRIAIAKLLISARANLDLEDGHGLTALAAATPGYETLALLLIDSGAAINTKSGVYFDGPSGVTPLHDATANPKILDAMLRNNAKLDVRDSNGKLRCTGRREA